MDNTCIPCPFVYLFAYFRVVCFGLLLTQPHFDQSQLSGKLEGGLISVGGGGGVMIGGIFLLQVDWPPAGYLGH